MGREETAVGKRREAVVDQQHQPSIVFTSDDPAGRLMHLVHTGDLIGVGEAHVVLLLEISADNLLFRANLRESDPHDNGTDQTVAPQVDALRIDAAQNTDTEQRFLRFGLELVQECLPFRLLHVGRLPDGCLLYTSVFPRK